MKSKIVSQCGGCNKIVNGNQCAVYVDPTYFVRDTDEHFMCPIRGYDTFKSTDGAMVLRVGQQKQKKGRGK